MQVCEWEHYVLGGASRAPGSADNGPPPRARARGKGTGGAK